MATSQRDIPDLAGPGPLHDDPVEIDVRMLAFDRRIPPFVDPPVDLLIELAHGRWRDPGAPQRLGDVLHAPHGHAGEIHLHEGLLDRAFPAAVALDDGRIEGLLAELRDLEGDLARLRMELALVMPGAVILAIIGPGVAVRPDETVGFGVEQSVQRLLDA